MNIFLLLTLPLEKPNKCASPKMICLDYKEDVRVFSSNVSLNFLFLHQLCEVLHYPGEDEQCRTTFLRELECCSDLLENKHCTSVLHCLYAFKIKIDVIPKVIEIILSVLAARE